GGGAQGQGGGKTHTVAMIFIVLCLIAAFFIYKSGKEASLSQTLPSLIPLFMIVAGLVAVSFFGERNAAIYGIGMVVVIIGVVAFAVKTAPALYATYTTGSIGKVASEASASTSSAGKGGLSGLVEDAVLSYRQQVAYATGETIDGDVDQQVKEEVGLEILPPYLPNPQKLNLDEVRTLEIGARIKAFDPKTPLHVTTVCHMQTRDQANSLSGAISRAGRLNLDPGAEQRLRPQNLEGFSFDRDITCYPTIAQCGQYIVTISSEADHIRTDAQMRNYIIDKTILNQRLRSYAESRESELLSTEQVNAAINEIYKGQLSNFRSVSQKGAIKVVMATQPIALIGVDQETELTFKLGVENMLKGWIRAINRVEVTVPSYFQPMSEFCDSWNLEGNKLILKDEYLRTADFYDVIKGQQKIFPSCHLVPRQGTDAYALTEPTEATFLALVDYNYVVQSENRVEIRTAEGNVCTGGSTSAQASATPGNGSSAESTTASTTKSATPPASGETGEALDNAGAQSSAAA
ncbi:hypothetical protein KY359_03525, partial [Candidatus Woesearchaeota archaeon]|nr:hypothetical protein [Candidatus Woesearchaeota archaeon]